MCLENSGKILEGRHHDENFDNSNMWSSSRKRSKRKLIQAKRTDRSNLQSKKSKRKSKRTTSSGVKQLAEDTSSVQGTSVCVQIGRVCILCVHSA